MVGKLIPILRAVFDSGPYEFISNIKTVDPNIGMVSGSLGYVLKRVESLKIWTNFGEGGNYLFVSHKW